MNGVETARLPGSRIFLAELPDACQPAARCWRDRAVPGIEVEAASLSLSQDGNRLLDSRNLALASRGATQRSVGHRLLRPDLAIGAAGGQAARRSSGRVLGSGGADGSNASAASGLLRRAALKGWRVRVEWDGELSVRRRIGGSNQRCREILVQVTPRQQSHRTVSPSAKDNCALRNTPLPHAKNCSILSLNQPHCASPPWRV